MQISVESTSAIERRLTIGVPSGQVDSEVEKRLQKNAKTIRLNGFRPGKVPMSVVRKRFGEGVRQEVVGEVMRDSYFEAIQNEKLSPVGYPAFEPKQVEAGKDIEFVAVVEVYPEIKVNNLSELTIEKEQTTVAETDIDTMIENLRSQSMNWVEKDGSAVMQDRVTLDYLGKVDGEPFEGGSATEASLELGSKKMIPGFEEALIGVSAGDEKTFVVTFPEDYHAENLRGKEASFSAKIHKVEQGQLPEVNDEFFAKYGVSEGGLEAFRAELKNNMEREANSVIAGKVKQQIVDQITAANNFDVPKILIKQEVDKIKVEAAQRFGLQESQASGLPDELFSPQAETRVKTGLLFAQIVKENDLKASDDKVGEKVKELATGYQDPAEVVKWYMNNPEQKQQIESLVLEDTVVGHILNVASVIAKEVDYETAVKPASPKAAEVTETAD